MTGSLGMKRVVSETCAREAPGAQRVRQRPGHVQRDVNQFLSGLPWRSPSGNLSVGKCEGLIERESAIVPEWDAQK